ncbi:MAG: hypothetical protein RL137_179 [Bacteroidota bacterium]
MDKILAKQIEGVVDTTSAQVIEGVKTFSDPLHVLNMQDRNFAGMRIDGLFIYWLRDFQQLDDVGNIRMGFDPRTGAFVLQQFTKQWENITL